MDLAAFPASSLKRLWLLPPEAASSTSGPVVLSKVSTQNQGWGWEGKDKRQKGAGAQEDLPSLGALEDGDSWAHVTFIHSATVRGTTFGWSKLRSVIPASIMKGLRGRRGFIQTPKRRSRSTEDVGREGVTIGG